jgi:serine/threonine protein kinase
MDSTLMDDRSGPGGAVAAPAPRPEHASGEVLDRRYRLRVRLGRGGFGDVWRAEELLPDGAPFREVALKLLISDFAAAADWADEAKLLASFRHPSLVTIYAAGLLDAPRSPFVSMELLEGENLADLVRRRGRVPWRRVVAWARDVAGALDVIHARGFVHLDLKPANLFLTHDGALKVLDFGISRRAGSAAAGPGSPGGAPSLPASSGELGTGAFLAEQDVYAATRQAFADADSSAAARRVIGTPGFMAPEILEMAEPTAATDAYALAVCIVQLATGHLPHEVPDEPDDYSDVSRVSAWWVELRSATLRGLMRDLEGDPARLPRGLLALVRRLLSVDPLHRRVAPGGLKALLDDLWERPHGVPDPPYLGLTPFPSAADKKDRIRVLCS